MIRVNEHTLEAGGGGWGVGESQLFIFFFLHS